MMSDAERGKAFPYDKKNYNCSGKILDSKSFTWSLIHAVKETLTHSLTINFKLGE